MSIPVLPDILQFLNNVDLNEPFEFLTDGVPEDFTNDTIRAAIAGPAGRLDLSSTDDTIVKTGPGRFQFNVDKVVVWQKLPAGVYDFDIVRSTPAGADNALLRGKIKMTKGATQP